MERIRLTKSTFTCLKTVNSSEIIAYLSSTVLSPETLRYIELPLERIEDVSDISLIVIVGITRFQGIHQYSDCFVL